MWCGVVWCGVVYSVVGRHSLKAVVLQCILALRIMLGAVYLRFCVVCPPLFVRPVLSGVMVIVTCCMLTWRASILEACACACLSAARFNRVVLPAAVSATTSASCPTQVRDRCAGRQESGALQASSTACSGGPAGGAEKETSKQADCMGGCMHRFQGRSKNAYAQATSCVTACMMQHRCQRRV